MSELVVGLKFKDGSIKPLILYTENEEIHRRITVPFRAAGFYSFSFVLLSCTYAQQVLKLQAVQANLYSHSVLGELRFSLSASGGAVPVSFTFDKTAARGLRVRVEAADAAAEGLPQTIELSGAGQSFGYDAHFPYGMFEQQRRGAGQKAAEDTGVTAEAAEAPPAAPPEEETAFERGGSGAAAECEACAAAVESAADAHTKTDADAAEEPRAAAAPVPEPAAVPQEKTALEAVEAGAVLAEEAAAAEALAAEPPEANTAPEPASEPAETPPAPDPVFAASDRTREAVPVQRAVSAETQIDEQDIAAGGFKTRYTIGFKLVTIISLIVVISCSLITVFVNRFVTEDVRISAEENNFVINARTALSVEDRLAALQDSVNAMLRMRGMYTAAGSDTALFDDYLAMFFDMNQDVYAVDVAGDTALINEAFDGSVSDTALDAVRSGLSDALERASNGELCIENVSPFFDRYMIALLYPFVSGEVSYTVMTLVSGSRISEVMESGSINSSFMVNNEGVVLYHSDDSLTLACADFSGMPLVAGMLAEPEMNMQRLFTDEDGTEYFGAYNKLASFGGAAVLTVVQSSVVFESVRATTRRNIYLSVAVLAAAVLVIWGFSRTMSVPVKILAAASYRIKEGEFDLNLKPRTHDELGLLTESFVSMGQGLAERERLKDTFGRFTNPAIAEQAMRGELALGGETKETTVFFSDIRSFTAISEKLSPSEVVSFLNDYMTRMVECVNATNGVVDKFIGDAVMAVWGAPVSSGSAAQDALNCIRAALMMRHSLMEFNVGRGSVKKPIIRIGCGINTGSVVAGQIGSKKRMEYTVIGDAVNFASRTEALNKPLGTDILVTENTYVLVKDHIIAEEMPSVTVKGKEKPVRMYAVVNMPEAADIPGAGPDGPETLSQVRQMLGIPEPDLQGVQLDAEEKKYKIQGQ